MMHIIQDTFKTHVIKLYTSVDFDVNNDMTRRMMTKLMNRVSPNYGTRQSFMNALEMYYGSGVMTSSRVLGNQALFTSTIRLISGNLVDEPHLLEDVLRFAIHDIFEQTFDNDALFQQEKKALLHQYKTLTNHKMQYASIKFKEVLYDQHPENVPLQTLIDTLEKVTLSDVRRFYHETFLKAPKIVFATGPFTDAENVLIRQTFAPYINQNINIEHEPIAWRPLNDTHITLDVEQAMLHIVYHLPIYRDEKDHIPAHLMTMILGYHGDSRLFRIVREEQGLCYIIQNQYNDEKGYMVIFTGVDHRAQDAALQSIKDVVESMKNGVTDKELSDAKQALIHQIMSNLDKQTSTIDRLFREHVYRKQYDLEARIKQIQSITKEDIKRVAEALNLMLIHRTIGASYAENN
jgi:predicted Zn-dependent peptidase